ncbi:hypothetical protein AUC59_13750, partial [Enterococcus faecium]
ADSRKKNSVACYFNQISSCLVVEKWSKMLLKWKNDKKVSLLYYILPFKFWLSLRTDIAVCNNSLLSSHDFFFMFPSM